MKPYKFLIVGSGMTADAAVRGTIFGFVGPGGCGKTTTVW